MKTRQPIDLNQLSKAQLIEQLSLSEKRVCSLNKLIEELAEQLRLKRHQQYGASSEKTDPNQQPELFDEAEDIIVGPVDDELAHGADEAASEAESTDAQTEAQTPAKKTPDRKPISPKLERRRVEHDIAEDDKTCHCGCQKTQIGEEVSEKLNVIPMQVFVEQHVRAKYACPACEGEVIIADPEPTLLPKPNAGIELQAFVVTGKFQDALPLHRQNGYLQAIWHRPTVQHLSELGVKPQ